LRLRSFGRSTRSLDRLWLFCSLPGDSIQVTEEKSHRACGGRENFAWLV
jgi:hypothetical protein